jgi:hypothetical protein
LTVNLDALYGSSGTPIDVPARVTNLSSTGLRLRTDRALVLNTTLDVAFVIPDVASRSRMKLRVHGRVVRVVFADPPRFEYAISLASDDDQKDLLRRAVLKLDLAMDRHQRLEDRA